MIDFDELLKLPIFTNSITAWLVAGAIAAAAFLIMVSLRAFVRRYHKKAVATAATELFEIPAGVLGRTTIVFFLVVALYLALQSLTVGPATSRVAGSAITIALFWQAGVWAAAAVKVWLERKRRRSMETDRAAVSSLGIIGFIATVLVWALVLLLTLDNLGVNITTLVAGLGIGGIAVALAVQNVLGDLFASLSIALDKPFVVGDFLIIDDFMGSVEYVGIKSTRLRSLSGEQIIMSNSDLLASRVRNYGRMHERRVVFATNVTYETSMELLERVPAIIRNAVQAQKDTRFDRSHFQKHGSASLDFETVYFVLSADFNKYMDIQQAINLQIHREFAEAGIEFAYPTQRLLMEAVSKPESPAPQ
jgi:small-conductance mechanosensitive channel